MRVLNILMIISVTFLSGCIPYRFTARTGTSGVVTDAHTGIAVSQAVITLSSGRTTKGPCQFSTLSDTNGMFNIPAEHCWGILPLGPLYPFRWSTEIEISARGYVSYHRHTFPCSTLGPGLIKLPDVKLEHEP